MGLALARSITSSIHELFMGTERVRQGDFTHRISINTKDQLGELAGSFNQMTGSIENLLQTAAEKKRLEEELRIARQIQMSLLPRGQLDMPGLGVTALCVPAREVGGDYYDFFPLGPGRLGVLIADVSGKGTSAALYMAELKGLMLALSQIYQTRASCSSRPTASSRQPRQPQLHHDDLRGDRPRQRRDDLRARRPHAAHLPARAVARPLQGAQILIPSGMVLGLRIDGAAAKFDELLEEKQIPLHTGDVIVFYTDGITEAMNTESDLFGDRRLSRIVEEHGHLDSGELRERILREIEAFVGTADQHDDMTMILMKVTGPKRCASPYRGGGCGRRPRRHQRQAFTRSIPSSACARRRSPSPARSSSRSGSRRATCGTSRRGSDTRSSMPAGGWWCPGFNDAHVHLDHAARRRSSVSTCGRRGTKRTWPRRLARSRGHPAGRGAGSRGGYWDHEAWPGKALPTRDASTRRRRSIRCSSSGSTGTWRSRTRWP